MTTSPPSDAVASTADHDSLRHRLLGPSLNKAGLKGDQADVAEVIYNASKGSKFFAHEEARDQALTQKIEHLLERKAALEASDMTRDLRHADQILERAEASRNLDHFIVHLDCDAFYASCEQLDQPGLADKPFGVGGGVLTTANYVARKFGVRSGMASYIAKRLCPSLIILPLDFGKYQKKANEMREVMATYGTFESASVDEAYLDLTTYCQEHKELPGETVQRLRDEIFQKTQITVSAGIGVNTRLAKIASNINKPNGQFVVPSDRAAIMSFMDSLPTRKVNGIGRVLERELGAIGIDCIGDIGPKRQLLAPLFGEKTAQFLLSCFLGVGRTRIQLAEDYERKSISAESTFRDTSDRDWLRSKLRSIADELQGDMEKASCKGRTVGLKVKLSTFEVYTRQVVTQRAVCKSEDLYENAVSMLSKLEKEFPDLRLRLMGIRCSHLISTKKPDTMAFFGLRPQSRPGSSAADSGSPAHVPTGAEVDGLDELALGSGYGLGDPAIEAGLGCGYDDDGSLSSRLHGREVSSSSKRGLERGEDWWDCCICNRPQRGDQNEHIDLCLSRQTIRDAIQASDHPPSAPERRVSTAKRPKMSEAKMKPFDPKQRRLKFS